LNRRFLAVAVAAAFAVLGIVLVLAYVHSSIVSAGLGKQPVTVLRVTKPIPAGTSLTAAFASHSIQAVHYPANSLPSGAVKHPSHQEYTEVFTSQLQAGAIITADMFGARSITSTPITPPGKTLDLSIPVCQSQAVAGYIGPGSMVTVVNIAGNGKPLQASCESHNAQGGIIATVVMPTVEVMRVQAAPPPGNSSSTPVDGSGTGGGCSAESQGEMCVVVAVPEADMLKVAAVAATGDLTLVLDSPNSVLPSPGATYTSP
jgi:pilus assembly protein CpaB